MTCEVAVLNKYAVVIAADSAVTTTNGYGEARYSKGGNKIFQLSHKEPVGIMIFGSAAVCGMPWEVVIKAYRGEHLQDNKFDSVTEYAENFFSFLKSAASPISAAVRDASFHSVLQRVALTILQRIEDDDPEIGNDQVPLAVRQQKASAAWTKVVAAIDSLPTASPELQAAETKSIAAPPQTFRQDVEKGLKVGVLSGIITPDELVTSTCRWYFRQYELFQPTTGVVIAGYGKLEYFPCIVEYSVSGFVGDEFVCREVRRTHVTNEAPGAILPFATTSAVDAFMRGVGADVFFQVGAAYERFAVDFARSMLKAAQVAEPASFEQEAEKSQIEFGRTWYGNVLASHFSPLEAVIASLPLEEMTHLAETLVTLESLKERVTSPKQSVGGPIDVAVITKAEGLVWIKRKHFFDSDKNLRFLLRQRAIYQ
ncbi:hypothetical protein GO298_02835 [Ralstonia solanacearum]|nr:hypothetical protein [Ralstonia solanacearum]